MISILKIVLINLNPLTSSHLLILPDQAEARKEKSILGEAEGTESIKNVNSNFEIACKNEKIYLT